VTMCKKLNFTMTIFCVYGCRSSDSASTLSFSYPYFSLAEYVLTSWNIMSGEDIKIYGPILVLEQAYD